MFRKLAACTVIALLLAVSALAHGTATHFMGTVTAVDKDTVTIKDKAGKSVMVTLGKATKYLKDKKPAPAADLKVGTRIVIDAKMDQKTKKYAAEEIQLGVAETAVKK